LPKRDEFLCLEAKRGLLGLAVVELEALVGAAVVVSILASSAGGCWPAWLGASGWLGFAAAELAASELGG